MSDFVNRTFDEIGIDATVSASRTLTATDVEALAIAAGDVDGFHIEGGHPGDRRSAQGAAAVAMIAGLLSRRLPGPGSAIVSTHFLYTGSCCVGDTLTATVTAVGKHAEGHRIEFACRCVNQSGVVSNGKVSSESAALSSCTPMERC